VLDLSVLDLIDSRKLRVQVQKIPTACIPLYRSILQEHEISLTGHYWIQLHFCGSILLKHKNWVSTEQGPFSSVYNF